MKEPLLPYEFEFNCIACSYNVIRRKSELSKISLKKKFVTRLKNAHHKKLCICKEVYLISEGNGFNDFCEVLTGTKNKKIKIKGELKAQYQKMNKNPDVEPNHYLKTAKGICKIGQNSKRLMKWML